MNNWRSDATRESLGGVDSPQEGVEVVVCITVAKPHDSHGSFQIIQVATWKVRGSSEHQADPAEHKTILQH